MMKDVERTTIDAALTGSRELAVKALALHPLVPSVTTAREIFDGYRRRLPALEERFVMIDLACAEPGLPRPHVDGLDALPGRGRSASRATACARRAAARSPRSAPRGSACARARRAARRRRRREPAARASPTRACAGRAAAAPARRSRSCCRRRRPRDGRPSTRGSAPAAGARRRRAARGRLSIPRTGPRAGRARASTCRSATSTRARSPARLPAAIGDARALGQRARGAADHRRGRRREAAAAQLGPARRVGASSRSAARCGRRRRRGRGVAPPASSGRRWTRPAPATCSPPPTSGPTLRAPLEERLRWAVLYAALSVRVATAVAGAVTLRALLEEGAARAATAPVASAAMKGGPVRAIVERPRWVAASCVALAALVAGCGAAPGGSEDDNAKKADEARDELAAKPTSRRPATSR